MTFIDLRSDTVTRPSPGMRKAMYDAEVGDMQYDDDPSLNRLQERVAALLGKEAALWFASGTQANQVALLTLTQRGDDVIVSQEAHVVWHEAGGGGANAGVQFSAVGSGGLFTAEDMIAAIKPRLRSVFPMTRLVAVENTHNRMGGRVFPQDEIVRIVAAARAHDMVSFLDGARLWNVAAATRLSPATLAAPFDVVMVAMSKGLGAPGGSLLAGPRDLLDRAVRFRRLLGGAMRQVGFFAAAAEYGLDHNFARLAEDHAAAAAIGRTLAQSPRVTIAGGRVETNIVVAHLDANGPDAVAVVAAARERGVLIGAFGPRTIRAVTHLDVMPEECERAAHIVREAIDG